MTALEAIAIREAKVQYDDARRSHQRDALLAHVADRHADWENAREAEVLVRQYAESELSPSTTDPAK